jgi:PAS domain S-box-containing protein
MSMPRLRVLYAEDSRYDAELTLKFFEDHLADFDVEVVDMGRACLARVAQHSYDVLLLDNHLPDMDGTDVLRRMAELHISMPVVVVTGVGDESLVVQVLRLGAWDYIPKSGDYREQLPAVLKSAVQEYGSLQEQRRISGQGPRRILYVERSPVDVDLTLTYLAEVAAPFQVEVVDSCEQALSLLLGGRVFDLVMIDLRMPDRSALDVLREAKYRGLTVPFLVITGKGDESAAVAALKLGAYDYIIKRDNYLTQIPYAIENAINRSQLQVSNERLQQELAARERAQESQQLLATIVQSSDDAIISKSLDGVITSWNRGAEKLYGYSCAEVVGRPLSILLPDERAEDLPEMMERLKLGESMCRSRFLPSGIVKAGRSAPRRSRAPSPRGGGSRRRSSRRRNSNPSAGSPEESRTISIICSR